MPGVKILWYLGDPFQGAGNTLLLVKPAIWILGYLLEELQGAGKIPDFYTVQNTTLDEALATYSFLMAHT